MIFHQLIFLFLNKYVRITSVYQIVVACVLHIKIEQNKNIVYIILQTVSFTSPSCNSCNVVCTYVYCHQSTSQCKYLNETPNDI